MADDVFMSHKYFAIFFVSVNGWCLCESRAPQYAQHTVSRFALWFPTRLYYYGTHAA